MKKILLFIMCAVFAFPLAGCNSGSQSEKESESALEERTMTDHAVYDGVTLSDDLWKTPDYYEDSTSDRTEDSRIKAIYLKTYYKGEETYAFCYIGIPENASAINKVPAVLLLHGGGGTAYWEWVKMWSDRGYVAIAPDLEGHVPTQGGSLSSAPADLYTKSKFPAPNNHNYDDSSLPLNETWMYYAVQTSIIANSYLHSLDYVDKYKIGVCGVSWGSVIDSIITGYDDRFAFSIPIYGSLALQGSYGSVASYYDKNQDALIWDDVKGLKVSAAPKLFICGNNDSNFSPKAISDCAKLCKNSGIVIKKDFLHSQYYATYAYEAYAFADKIVNNGGGLIGLVTEPQGLSGSAKIKIPQGLSVDSAYVVYTEDDFTAVASWSKKRCEVSGDTLTYTAPLNAASYYILIEDNRGYNSSSFLINLK